MRRAAMYIFILVSASALAAVFCNSNRFKPPVSLPQVDAGKPLTGWPGIVITCKRDGRVVLGGQVVNRLTAREQIVEAVKVREDNFKEAAQALNRKWPKIKPYMTPVLLCIDKDASLEDCLKLFGIPDLTGCVNLYFAVEREGNPSAVSLCTYIFNWGERNRYYGYWKGEATSLTENIRGIDVRANRKGHYRFLTGFGDWGGALIKPEIIVEGEEKRPKTSATIEPLFKLIEKHKNEDTVIILRLSKYAKNLTWEWLAKLLVRLEKTSVRGYIFTVPEDSY